MPEEAIGEPASLEGQAPIETPSEVTPPVESEAPVVESEQEDDLSNWTVEDAVKKVKEGRQENQKLRDRVKKFESTFAELDDEGVQGFLGLVTALRNGDQAAVPVLESILAELSPAEQEQLQEALEEADETPKSLTPEEVEKMLEDRDAQKEAERLAQENFNHMKSEIEGLGYTLDEEKPDPDTALLFFFAGQQKGAPDFKEAHAQAEVYRNSVIEGFKKSVNERNSRFLRTTSAGAATPAGPGGNKALRLKDGSAAAAMEEFLKNAE